MRRQTRNRLLIALWVLASVAIVAWLLTVEACGSSAVRGEGSIKVAPDGQVTASGLIGIAAGPINALITQHSFKICIDWPIPFCWAHPLDGGG